MLDTIWINNKTKTEYVIVAEVIDCTNRDEGTKMFAYIEDSIDGYDKVFVRDQQEFFEKFTRKE